MKPNQSPSRGGYCFRFLCRRSILLAKQSAAIAEKRGRPNHHDIRAGQGTSHHPFRGTSGRLSAHFARAGPAGALRLRPLFSAVLRGCGQEDGPGAAGQGAGADPALRAGARASRRPRPPSSGPTTSCSTSPRASTARASAIGPQRYNKELVEIEVPYNEAIDPAAVAEAFRKRPDIKVVSLVHHDTPSGTINPAREIGKIVRDARRLADRRCRLLLRRHGHPSRGLRRRHLHHRSRQMPGRRPGPHDHGGQRSRLEAYGGQSQGAARLGLEPARLEGGLAP